jgi:UDP-N-acetylglucosamine 4,6-dehydratase
MKQTVLVTGGTGFLGRYLGLALKENYNVVLAARNNAQNALVQEFTGCEVLPLDVVNIESVRDAFNETRPAVVIHAAATKYVDLAERQPMECVDVNILGSQNVARVAVERGAEVVVGISTDKAAPPVRNTYGLSKAMMERIFCSMNGKAGTKFACTRFGNIAWSTGSVLPVWKRMHETTGVIGTTGPECRRYFFSVQEAVKLVLTALEHIDELQGKVLSRDMKAAQVRDVLDTWIKYRGGQWEKIASRPGERIDEVLIGELELPYTTEVLYDGVKHHVISFNEKASRPLQKVLTSEDSERLTEQEILALINNEPEEF